MPEPVADQSARIRALDPGESSIVEAPAGSGKTELLIQRFLTLLGRVESPESIAAITFTRKAAGEMRHRVLGALGAAEREPPAEPHERQTWDLARLARARDRERSWRLSEFPARLRIQTIDALCSSLVGRMPWISRMGRAPRPEERVGYLYRRAARATLELLEEGGPPAAALDRLLRHLDNDLGILEDLLVGMLRCRDQWLRHVVGATESRKFRDMLESAFGQIGERHRGRLRALFHRDQMDALLELARFAVQHLPHPGPEAPLARLAASDRFPDAGGEDIDRWEGLAALLLTDRGERRRRVDARQGFPPTPAGRAAKERFKALDLDDALLERLHAVRSLPPASFTEPQWKVLSAIGSLLPLAAAQLKVVFQQEGCVDFTELAHAAARSLGTPEEPTDLAFSLDCRIEHLLVDEFQDTSQTQYELLRALTAEWVPGDGRTLFLVGDPMQSIYGFREADVALFLRARRDGVGHLRPVPLALSVNFRSAAGIVGWVNRALPPAFSAEEDLLTGAVQYAASTPFHPEAASPAVRVHPFFDDDPAAEADRVLELIGEAESAHPEGSIAVLVRARGHLVRIVSLLRSRGKRFQAVEIDRLEARPVVRDLLALTRALLHPADRPAWLAVLRAPWCGLTLADLDALIAEDSDAAVWDLMADADRRAALSADGRQRLERVSGVLGPSLALAGRLPLRRWVEGTWIALGGPATVDTPTGLEDAAACLDLLEDLSAGAELEDREQFEEAVDGLFARPDVNADGRLQLLTVHKAKGLEFDTVILPGLGRATRDEEQQLMLWLEHIDEDGDVRLLCAPVKETGSGPDPAYRYLANIRKAKSENEDARLLYVAATRAKKCLHLLGHTRLDTGTGELKAPPARTLLSKVWHAVKLDFESAVEEHRPVVPPSEASQRDVSAGVLMRRLTARWVPPAPPPEIEWRAGFILDSAPAEPGERDLAAAEVRFDWATDRRRRVGIVVHACLQRMRSADPSRWDRRSILNALAAEGLDGGPLQEASQAAAALGGVLADARGRWILADHDEDRREYALTGVVGGRVRRFILDRTFVDGGVRWIIDYKTGTPEGGDGGDLDAFLDREEARYRPQLDNYGRLMRGLDPRPIRLGLYFPLVRGWREWEFGERAAGGAG